MTSVTCSSLELLPDLTLQSNGSGELEVNGQVLPLTSLARIAKFTWADAENLAASTELVCDFTPPNSVTVSDLCTYENSSIVLKKGFHNVNVAIWYETPNNQGPAVMPATTNEISTTDVGTGPLAPTIVTGSWQEFPCVLGSGWGVTTKLANSVTSDQLDVIGTEIDYGFDVLNSSTKRRVRLEVDLYYEATTDTPVEITITPANDTEGTPTVNPGSCSSTLTVTSWTIPVSQDVMMLEESIANSYKSSFSIHKPTKN